MSAFVLQPESILALASGLYQYQLFKCQGPFVEQGEIQALAIDLYEMNYRAVNERYKENDQPIAGFLRCKPTPIADEVELFALLSCYVYQCKEGSVTSLDLYKKVLQAKYNLACEIVRAMPAFKETGWSW